MNNSHFACSFSEFTGYGETLNDAFQDMLVSYGIHMDTGEEIPQDNWGIEPHECLFYKMINVEIGSRNVWDIQPA